MGAALFEAYMGYDITLRDPKTNSPCQVANHEEGGTYVMGGSNDARLSVTYNYAKHFYATLGGDGVRSLYGKTGEQSIPLLEQAVAQLGTERYEGPYLVWDTRPGQGEWWTHPLYERYKAITEKDEYLEDPQHADFRAQLLEEGVVRDTGGYWKSTPGNAGYALFILLSWAKRHPEGVWEGD